MPVEEYSLAHLRDAVAMVLQKNTLFSGSLRENLLWGNPEAPDEERLRACRIARVDEFLDRLENGLDTEVCLTTESCQNIGNISTNGNIK